MLITGTNILPTGCRIAWRNPLSGDTPRIAPSGCHTKQKKMAVFKSSPGATPLCRPLGGAIGTMLIARRRGWATLEARSKKRSSSVPPALKNNTNSSHIAAGATVRGAPVVTTAVDPAPAIVVRPAVWWIRRGSAADLPAVTVKTSVPTVAVRRCPTCPQPPKR